MALAILIGDALLGGEESVELGDRAAIVFLGNEEVGVDNSMLR